MLVYIFIGTTAEFIKISPVIKELRKYHIQVKLITSGQGKILFEEFKPYLSPIKSDISFNYKGEKSSPTHFVSWAVKTLFFSLISLKHEFSKIDKNQTFFIVQGDTVSSLIGALVAFIYKLKLVHIESGLRSFNFLEPFPEEICRYIISQIADINFCPNQWSVNNIKSKKGFKINTYQNTLLDIHKFAISQKNSLMNLPTKYFVLVMHRQEHVIFNRKRTIQIFNQILKITQNIRCVFIMHQLTSDFVKSMDVEPSFLKNKRIVLLPRLSYFDFTTLLKNSQFVITDGGSNQEECYYLGKPCFILRNRTERTEGLGESAVLGGFSTDNVKNFVSNYKQYIRHPVITSLSPSQIISKYLISYYDRN